MASTLPPSSSSLQTAPLKLHPSFHRFITIKPSFSHTRRLRFECRASQQEGVTEDPTVTGSSARAQLDLLEQLKSSPISSVNGYKSNSIQRLTIREQLSELIGDSTGGDFTIPIGKRLKNSTLTISKKRNIKRQALLTKVSGRNDSVFFATVGAFVILPPFVILAIAVSTGYVQLLP
ncbi:hypothetical protein LUZ60_008195 [Juncus effusus]|nr:hypothetical protein LUZ60_008195 [Juncus effusus]